MKYILPILFFGSVLITGYSQTLPRMEIYYQRDSIQISDPSRRILLPPTHHFGLNAGTYWFALCLKELPAKARELTIQIPTHNIDTVYLYAKTVQGLRLLASGRGPETSSHTFESRFPTFRISRSSLTTSELILKTTFRKDTNFPVKIYFDDDYYRAGVATTTWSSLYYGMLFAVVLFNLFFYIKFQDDLYLLYVFFLVAYTLAMFYYDGYFRLLPVDLEWFAHLIIQVTMFVFSFRFLSIDRVAPYGKRVALVMVLVMAACECLYLVTDHYIFFALGDVVAMCSFLGMWIAGVRIVGEVQYARFYVFGYFILIVCGYYYILSYNFGLFAIDANVVFFKIASAIDMLIFTYAISFRMDVMAKEHLCQIAELKSFIDSYSIRHDVKKIAGDPFLQLLYDNELSEQPLTRREIEILKLLYQGESNKAIADKLFVSINTVKFHTKNIYQKLDIKNRGDVQEKLSVIVSV